MTHRSRSGIKDETDVLPAFQLSYGHALCQADVNQETIGLLAKHLELGPIEYVGGLDQARLPVCTSAGVRTLQTAERAHVLVARCGDYDVVFAPHVLFFNNERWIKWNKRARGLMAIVTRHDLAQSAYVVFRDGQRVLTAWADGGQVRCVDEPAIEVYMNGDPIYRETRGEPRLSEAVARMLRRDVRVEDGRDGVRFAGAFTGEPVTDVTHYVFRKSTR